MVYNFNIELQNIESSLRKMLPSQLSGEWNNSLFGLLPECVTTIHTSVLADSGRNLIKLGGKRWRPLLLVLCAQAVADTEDTPQAAYELAPLVELAHTASLIHDDIEDSADTRRGAPAAHIIHGLDVALNAGTWMYFAASNAISNSGLNESQQLLLHRLYARELRRLHLGQAMDIMWHKDNTAIPTVAEYTAMVRLKTGTLASLAAQVGIIAGGGTESQAIEMGQVAGDIGIGFQVLDDVINLTTGNSGKKRGDDIVEGKKSLPVLLHLASCPEDFAKIMASFQKAKEEGIESSAVEECIQIISSKGAIEKAKDMAALLISEACAKTKQLYPNSIATDKIAALFTDMMGLN